MATEVTKTAKQEALSSVQSYHNNSSRRCWYDDCNCEDIAVADCDALVEENNEGIGRYACMADTQECYNKNFIKHAFQKITCQFDHIIQNICGLWDMIECMGTYIAQLGNMGGYEERYMRHSGISSADFYRPMTESYDIDLYMDSTTGVDGENDDNHRQMTDKKYRVWVRWCADGTNLDPSADNTMVITLYKSGETFDENLETQRSVHWQMTGMSDGAMEMSDSILINSGEYLRIHVGSKNNSSGIFRVHQVRVEYMPIIEGGDLPECIQAFVPPEEEECECAKEKASVTFGDTTLTADNYKGE